VSVNTAKFMIRKNIIVIIFALVPICGLHLSVLSAKDTFHITSDETAKINKSKGTLILKKNVVIIQQSSQSTIKTDNLFVQRDTTSDQVVKAIADGNVEIQYQPLVKKSEHRDQQHNQINKEPNTLKAVNSTCKWAAFDRQSGLIEMRGSVLVKSVDYLIEADHIKYYYNAENGRMTALPGEQVTMTFFRQVSGKGSGTLSSFDRYKTRASADLVLINRAGRKITFQGRVDIFDSKDQSQMNAHRAELFFDDNEDLERMIANGKFIMTQPKRVSKADRAVFEYRSEEVTLIGNAYVKEEDQIEISSSLIKMHIEAEKGIISGADKVPVKMKVKIE
jgi:lipopolysaccharide export system protein LptA